MSELSKVIYGQKSVEELTGIDFYHTLFVVVVLLVINKYHLIFD